MRYRFKIFPGFYLLREGRSCGISTVLGTWAWGTEYNPNEREWVFDLKDLSIAVRSVEYDEQGTVTQWSSKRWSLVDTLLGGRISRMYQVDDEPVIHDATISMKAIPAIRVSSYRFIPQHWKCKSEDGYVVEFSHRGEDTRIFIKEHPLTHDQILDHLKLFGVAA